MVRLLVVVTVHITGREGMQPQLLVEQHARSRTLFPVHDPDVVSCEIGPTQDPLRITAAHI